jgi:hypothetical protein
VRDIYTIVEQNERAQRAADAKAAAELERKLARDFQILDAIVTGNDPINGRGGREIPECCTELAAEGVTSHHYYLSDGGYSRVVISEDGALRLTDNSRRDVIAAWDSAGAYSVRIRIETAITKRQYAIIGADD